MQCPNVGVCPSHGTAAGENDYFCEYTRELCVFCTKDASDVVTVWAHSDGMPSNCYQSGAIAPAQHKTQFSALWLVDTPDMVQGDVSTQSEVNDLICTETRSEETNIPSDSSYLKGGANVVNDAAWGIATNGVLIYNSIATKVDPFYPNEYDSFDPSGLTFDFDWCLSNLDASKFFNYNAPSTCIADPATYSAKKETIEDEDSEDVAGGMITTAYTKSLPFRSVYGLAKDGRPIYTPFKNDGETYDDCDVDVCNGVKFDGHYSYVATLFHPYFLGCYGPGNNPDISQECSGNPKKCVEEAAVEEDENSATAKALSVLSIVGLISSMY